MFYELNKDNSPQNYPKSNWISTNTGLLIVLIRLKFVQINFTLYRFSIVIDTLNKLDEDRKCFRLIGGVLVERQISDVLPTLIKNRTEVSYIMFLNKFSYNV